MRRAARTDANHAEIKAALRQIGATILDLSMVGEGCPDLAVGYRGRTFLLEIKDSAKPPSRRKLTGDQRLFAAEWRGHYAVVTSVEEAIAVVVQGTLR